MRMLEVFALFSYCNKCAAKVELLVVRHLSNNSTIKCNSFLISLYLLLTNHWNILCLYIILSIMVHFKIYNVNHQQNLSFYIRCECNVTFHPLSYYHITWCLYSHICIYHIIRQYAYLSCSPFLSDNRIKNHVVLRKQLLSFMFRLYTSIVLYC